MLRILTWLWGQPGGRTNYTAGHVNIWAGMVERHLKMPHTLACVTDMPEGLRDDIEVIPPPRDFEDVVIPTWGGNRPRCHRRIAMFRPDAAEIFGERFVCMDVDCVIGGPLDPIFDRDEDIVLYSGSAGRPPLRPYNGSMLLMTAGCRPQVYERFTYEGAVEAGHRFIGSDQAWVSHVLGYGEATFGPDEGVFWWGNLDPERCGVLFFPGNPKPWELLGRHGWVTEHYRGAEGGKCLILGVGRNVWRDAAAAGDYDAVIAFPEAAMRWPGPVREVVDDERAARLAARMHGFDEVIWCGREGK